jgi:hypothetical protein
VIKRLVFGFVGLVALVVLAVLGLALTKPSELFVERQATISATPSVVYALINDLHRFNEWSPWAKRDPEMTTSFEGPSSGVGASYSWRGNRDVGVGRLTITDALIDSKVGMRLEFIEPFAATNQVQFSLTPSAEGTRVTWAMSGRNDFMSKLGSVFIDVEGMIGKDFDSGLRSLKTLAERA